MISDAVTVTTITGILGLITTIFTGIMAFMTVKLNIKASAAATAVDGVRIKAEEAASMVNDVKVKLASSTDNVNGKLEEISKVGKAVHALVNSAMTAQLKINAIALRRLAFVTNNPEDAAAADVADNLLKEHLAAQPVTPS